MGNEDFRPLSQDAAADPPRPVSVVIDGEERPAEEDRPLIEVFTRDPDSAKAFPQVCYHPDLGAIQTCDTCFVEIDGELVRACATPATPGLEVTTTGASAKAREEAGQRLVRKHVLYCTVCDHNDGGCTLKHGVEAAGVEHQRIDFEPKPYEIDDSNPFYRYDPDQCILCGRCVEACQDVQVTETLSIDWESDDPRVLWDGGSLIGESSCVSCGHCVTVCPCNALMEKTMLGRHGLFTDWPTDTREEAIDLVKAVEPTTGYLPLYALSKAESTARQAVTKVTKTVCTYCGVGCSFDVETRGREILRIQPQSEGPANAISTCVKGKFGWDHINAADRLTVPLVRDGDRFREATWDEALDLIASRLRGIVEESGPDAVAVIGSSKATNEESYLTQKLARQVLGTHNTDNCSRYCQAPATKGLWRTVGYGGDAGSISDMERAELVLIVGSNTSDSHPVIAARLRRAQKLGGHQLVVADLRRHEMAQRADVFLRPNPGTDLIWLSAVTEHILDQGWADDAFLEERVSGLDDYRASLEPFTLEYAEQRTGIATETLVDVARRVAEAGSVVGLWAMGVTQHSMGSDTSTAISNLLLVTGNYGRPGTGAYPLRGHNNVQGCSDFGTINSFYPGYQPVGRRGGPRQVRPGLGPGAVARARPGQPRDGRRRPGRVGARHRGRRRGALARRRQHPLRAGGAGEAGLPRRLRAVLLPHLRVRGRDPPGRGLAGEGRHVHQHRATHPAALRRDGPDRRGPARLADPPGHRRPPRLRVGLHPPQPGHGRDRRAHADVRRGLLLPAGGLRLVAVAGRRGRHRHPAALHRPVPLRRRAGPAAPARVPRAHRPARRGVPAPRQQRPGARALPRGQPDAALRGAQPTGPGHLRRDDRAPRPSTRAAWSPATGSG